MKITKYLTQAKDKAQQMIATRKKVAYKEMAYQAPGKIGRMFGRLKIKVSLLKASRPGQVRVVAAVSAGIMIFSVGYEVFKAWNLSAGYDLDPAVESILFDKRPDLAPLFQTDLQAQNITFNNNYSPSVSASGQSGTPRYKAEFSMDPAEGSTISDPASGASIKFIPKFRLKKPVLDENRLIYPILGSTAVKVVTTATIGYKEDIILTEPGDDTVSYVYELQLSAGIEARLENDGSLGFYGVDPVLLGNVNTGSEEDAELLKNALENGEKNNLIFRSPPPYILEENKELSPATAWYTLENNTLTLHASGLYEAGYPLSIDPSIYVESAAQLMRGNNETNVDFDVANELIQKGSTTGARIDDWTATMSLNEGRWNAGTAVAGGYVYSVGGTKSNSTTTIYSVSGSDTFVVPSGITSVIVKMWGAGAGGGGGSTNGDGGNGGGGGFVQTTLSVTPSETLDVFVGGPGGAGNFSTGTGGNNSGDGGGGGGNSIVERSGTPLAIAAAGGGGGGGDNSSATPGGAGGAGGGTTGSNGGASSSAPGGSGGTASAGGGGGNGTGQDGASGGSEFGGNGGDGGAAGCGTTGINNGGTASGGDGGIGDDCGNGFGGGGGGGSGLFGGGGGSASISANAGGGGGGGGSSYVTGSSTTVTGGSGTVPGNDSDAQREGAGEGGSGGSGTNSGTVGTVGRIIIITTTQTEDTVSYVRSNGSTGTSTTLDIDSAGTNRLVVVVADDESSGTNLTGATVDGKACNLVVRANNGSGAGNHQEMWYCDEDDLGASNESVTVAITGGDGSWAVHAHLYTGVSQAGPGDFGIDNSSVGGSTVTVNNIDVPQNGLVVMGAGNGQSGTWIGWTSPLTERTDSPNPTSAVLGTASDIETSAQTNKTYTATASVGDILRGTGIVASWDHGLVGSSGNEVRPEVYWARLSTTTSVIESPNPGAGACTDWCTNSAYDLPDERAALSLVAYNGFLYAIGGVDDSGVRSNDIYIAKLGANGEPSLWHPTDTNKNNWVYWYQSATYDLSSERSYMAAAAYNNRIYILGGQTDASSGGVTTVEYANLSPTGLYSSWSSTGMSALPSARHGHGVHVYNDYLYLVGGNSSGTLQSSVHYARLNGDGTMNAWVAANSFTTARSTWGGTFTTVWGGYIYLGGGCSAVNGSGYCTTIADDVQLASINADGSLAPWGSMSNISNQRIGYGLVSWRNAIYRVGGCLTQDTSSGACDTVTATTHYGEINPAGEVSTVSISVPSGSSPCSGGSPTNCDLPPPGDDAGEGGQMLSATTILNGYLYVVGGCIDYDCSGTNPAGDDADVSGNVSYVSIGSDGSLSAPSSCGGTSYGAWCVDSTNRINGTTGVAAAGVATFNNRIYIVGGLTGVGISTNIYYNSTNSDGSLAGAWSSVDMTTAGIAEDVAYTYAYARANPASAGTNPGNLFIFGGCGNNGGGAGCAGSDYETEVYKCNITTTGSVSGCSTSGQLQIDSDPGTGGAQGLGIHSGTVYANYVFLVGGFSQTEGDKDDVLYARIDNNNNVVAVSGGAWIESPEKLSIGRRRGWAFGYNGHIYAVGGYDDTGTGIIPFIEWSKMNVSDGSIDSFITSSVTINQRWGLSMAVSNSYAYVIGGCDVGASPSSCSSFEPSIQTFQLYNNDSGTPASYSASANQFNIDRLGASAAVLDGYIYLAGGCTDAADGCLAGSVTDDVQYASLDAYGNIGTWSSTTDDLPAERVWGQLESIEDTLYYIGGSIGTECDPSGDAFYEKYDGISGTAISALYADQDFPDNPNSTQTIAGGELASPVNIDDNFGGRLSALICPPQDGDYTFYVSGDDGTELRLSTDTNPANVSVIAEVPGWSAVEEWDKYAEQTSSAVTLEAGRYYYIEANYKEGGGGDHVEIGWTLPDATDELPIPDTRYSMPDATDEVIDSPVSTVYYATPGGAGDITSWSTASNGLPGERSQHGAAVWNDRMYVTGGTDDTGSSQTTVYVSPQLSSGGNITSAWSTSTAFNVARNGHTTIAYANNLYVLGGYTGSDYLSDVQFSQINTDGTVDAWSYTTSLPSPIRQADGFATNGYMYLFGGRSADTTCLSRTLVAPISANTTIATGNNPTGIGEWYETNQRYSGERYGNAAAHYQGKAYVLGGACTSASAPAVQSITSTTVSTASTTHNVSMPATVEPGDLLLALFTNDGGATITTPGDWTAVGSTADSTNLRASVFAKYADGTEDGGTVNFQTSASETATAQVYRILAADWYGSTTTGVDVTGASAGTTTTPDPASLDPGSWDIEPTLWLAYAGGSTYSSVTSYPSTYTNGTHTVTTATDDTGASTSSARLTTSAASENPGSFTMASSSSGVAYTVGVRPSLAKTGANRAVQTALLSQPQVAKYSRMIDTDTDVFPNRWLMNGVDNSIGARWQTIYRSSTAANAAWGQETNFGDTSLGTVNTYTPLDGSGSDTDFARYFYFSVSVDASQTYGYPDDVERGPTITDITLFFTADPGKRLRHGKTFTGGEKQPLDTPPGP